MWLLISCIAIFTVSALYTLARYARRALRIAARSGVAPRPVKPIDPSLRGEWHASFWEMEDAPGGHDRCLYVHVCWCLAAGEVAKRTGGSYSLDCCLGGVAGMYIGFYPCCWGLTRARLRALHGIPGSLPADVCATALFPCCYLAQALNQLDVADGISAAAPRMPDVARGRFGKQAVSSQAGAAKAAGGEGVGVGVGTTPLAVRPAAPAGALV